MRNAVLSCALLLAGSALAGGVENAGRISLGAGARWTPNWYLSEHAAAAGTPLVDDHALGPSFNASFGYGLMSWLELSIDFFGGWEPLAIQRETGVNRYNSFMGAAAIGARIVGKKLWGPVSPWLSVQGGGLFSSLTGPDVAHKETFGAAFFAGGGIDVNLTNAYGLSLDVRYLHGRNYFPGISSFNAGGVMVTLSFVMFFPGEQKRELEVPGF